MSIPKQTKVVCSQCKRQFEATVFGSLNTDFAPDIIEQVISGDRFSAKCPHCGFAVHLEYDLLYHDINHGAMVWVIHENNPEYAKKVAEVRSTHLLPYDVTRIVPDMNALREKAACLASGKDDRIVELCKVFLVSQLYQQMPDFDFENAFYTYHDGRDIVYFYDADGKEIGCDLDDKVYSMIAELFNKPLSKLGNSPFQIIDYSWAVNFFDTLPPAEEIETMIADSSEHPEPDKLVARDAADYIEANRSISESESADSDYGLVPEKPIYTALLDGQIEYLSSLRTLGGQTISWNRKGSTAVEGINGLVDIYETYLPSGKPYKTLYLNMYSDKTSKTPPAGFSILISGDDNSTEALPATGSILAQNNVDTAFPSFCRKCGAKLPDDSMFCYKCGTKIEPCNNTQVNTPPASTAGNIRNVATPNPQARVNSSSTNSNLKTGLIFGAALLALVLIAAFFSCFFGHKWSPATCDEPKTCSRCGKTEGSALGHTWVAATCTEAKYCSVCGQESGFPAGHKWVSESADTPQTCIVCGKMQPLPLPETGKVFIGDGKYCYSELTIKSSSTSACYIKLKDANGSDAYSFFVRAGDTVTVPVPPGYYKVYFAYGKDWYGPDLLFGSDTVCEKDDDLLDFKQYTWEYTLYPITNGNFSATPISLDEF